MQKKPIAMVASAQITLKAGSAWEAHFAYLQPVAMQNPTDTELDIE